MRSYFGEYSLVALPNMWNASLLISSDFEVQCEILLCACMLLAIRVCRRNTSLWVRAQSPHRPLCSPVGFVVLSLHGRESCIANIFALSLREVFVQIAVRSCATSPDAWYHPRTLQPSENVFLYLRFLHHAQPRSNRGFVFVGSHVKNICSQAETALRGM